MHAVVGFGELGSGTNGSLSNCNIEGTLGNGRAPRGANYLYDLAAGSARHDADLGNVHDAVSG